MALNQLEIRRSSAAVWGALATARDLPKVSKYVDTTLCIGCKACEVACQEWNDLPEVATTQIGSYQTMPELHANYWNLIRFNEQEHGDSFSWLMRKDQCMHCEEPGCLEACPAPGAIVQYTNGIVDVDPDRCIGCGYCAAGCPFNVPKFHEATGKMQKCTLCVDRTRIGLEPACVKACPTGCLHYGTKDDMVGMAKARVIQLKSNGFANADVYDPAGVGGTGVITVLAHGDHPEWYGLPKEPTVPISVTLWKKVLRPLGFITVVGAVVGAFAHHLYHGNKGQIDPGPRDAGEPQQPQA